MANQELIEYIKEVKDSGGSNKQIKQALLEKGWEENVVNNEIASADSKLKYFLFVVASLLSLIIFVFYSGWELLIIVPTAGTLIFFTTICLLIIFRKNHTDTFTLFIAFTVITLFNFSLRLNTMIASDGYYGEYWGSYLTTEKLKYFSSPLFHILLAITAIIFLVSLAFIITSVISLGKLSKKKGILLLLAFIILIAIHFSIVAVKSKKYLENKSTEQALQAYRSTFINRYFSYVELDKDHGAGCANTSFALTKIGLNKTEYNITCLSNIFSGGKNNQLPIEHESVPSKNRPQGNRNFINDQLLLSGNENDPNQTILEYKEGDVVGVTVKLPSKTLFVLDAPGNKVSDLYFDDRYISVEKDSVMSTGYFYSHDKAILTFFYPINRDEGLDRLYMYMAEGGGDYKILEIATIRGSYTMPQNIKEWQQKIKQTEND